MIIVEFQIHNLAVNDMFKIKEKYHFWVKLTVIYFLIQSLIRVILIWEHPSGFIDTIDSVLDGVLWDMYAWLFISFPLMILALTVKQKYHHSFLASKFNHIFTFVFTFFFTYIALCELMFWNEFHSRFNFIAVDYLIYTNEVLANIRESYPIVLISFCILIIATSISIASSFIPFTNKPVDAVLRRRTVLMLFGFILPSILAFGIGPWLEEHDENFHDDQISRNGLVEFVRAFRSNKIDYQAFYPTIPQKTAQDIFQKKIAPLSELSFVSKKNHPNVVVITVESLGAKFISGLGGQPETTPYLNALAKSSLFFTNFYATGTRTVRGLEAINLSVPPTPGYAVVKRPEHKGLFSMGRTFSKNGYEPIFLYGGSGFFDNMNSFFSGNGFSVHDLSDFDKSEITFSNAWGVCDEDLFQKARKTIQARTNRQQPFLMFLLTTSNHRPFTYPEGKIDIPSGTSRAGAVKYTDYAIGNFLKNVKNDEWAKNTIFVIVADHSTEGRGQFDLEMSDFHIPLWIYSPGLIKPQVVSKTASQIDLLPSLIHLLGLQDNSPFFGQSMFNENWKEERAFVGNYQYVGYYRDQVLTTLGPNRMIRNYHYDPKGKIQESQKESIFIEEAISHYQVASKILDKGEFKAKKD